MDRRGFLSSLGSGIICAPAIVRAASIMPVRNVLPIYNSEMDWLRFRQEITMEYITEGLFSPYKVEAAPWIDWARSAVQANLFRA